MPKIKVSTLVYIKCVSENLIIEHNSLNLLTQQQIFPVTQGVNWQDIDDRATSYTGS